MFGKKLGPTYEVILFMLNDTGSLSFGYFDLQAVDSSQTLLTTRVFTLTLAVPLLFSSSLEMIRRQPQPAGNNQEDESGKRGSRERVTILRLLGDY